MNKLVITLLVSIFVLQVSAQQTPTPRERIRQLKKTYVASKIGLTSEQEKKFLPLYDQYIGAEQEVQQKIRLLRIETNALSLSDSELNADIDKMLVYKQQQLDLEREYIGRFRTFLSSKQVVEMYKAEKLFVRTALKELRGSK